MNKNQKHSPKKVLQLAEKKLSQSHDHRLQQMTRATLQRLEPSRLNIFSISFLKFNFKPILVFSFGIILVINVILLPALNNQPDYQSASQSELSSSLVTLPLWVEDTNVPVALLGNLNFYQWLDLYHEQRAQQTPIEAHHTSLAVHLLTESDPVRRHSAFNPAKRLARAITVAGAF